MVLLLESRGATDVQIRSHYFVDRLRELLDPKNEMEFNDYVYIGGLLELTRQYATMPLGVKELSAHGLRDSIIAIIDKHGTLLAYRERIPIKEFKKPLSLMFLISKLKSEKYIAKLFSAFSEVNTFTGIMRTIKHVVEKGLDVERNKHDDVFKILDDLIFLLIEYLDYKGNTLPDLLRFCNQKKKQSNSVNIFDELYKYINSLGYTKVESLEKMRVLLEISCTKEHVSLVHGFTRRLLKSLIDGERIDKEIKESKQDQGDGIVFQFVIQVYKVDDKYLDRLLKTVYIKYDALIERTKYSSINVSIVKCEKKKNVEIKRSRVSSQSQAMKIKHFDRLWMAANFEKMDPNVYDEIFRIHEWVSVLNRTTEKQLSFNALWSMMEFMLVDSVHENKIESICSNFIPYMGLFYFRKVIKTYFRKLVRLHGQDKLRAQRELVDLIKRKLGPEYSDKTIADAFCIFLFDKDLRKKWWDGIEFQNANKSYINILTDRIHSHLKDPNIALDRFESIVKNDLRQMYRLRNMLTHSGVNDVKILDNTYDRLKYYVETLLNAVAYAWLDGQTEVSTVFDLNDLKRGDWQMYRDSCKSNKQKLHENKSLILSLVNYRGLTKIPPNRFSFLNEASEGLTDPNDA